MWCADGPTVSQPTIQQIIRVLMVGALGAMLGVLGLLGVIDGLVAGGLGGEWVWQVFSLMAVTALSAGVAGAAIALRFFRNLPFVATAIVLVLVAMVFVAATLDDAEFTHPLTLDEFSPAVSHGNESWELTVRDWPEAALSAISGSSSAVYVRAPLTDPIKYTAELSEKREQIDLAWANLAEARDWLAQLNAFAEIGDETSARIDAPILKFALVRAVTQVSCARAALLALDGRGDEAAEVLLPVIEVSRKLEPGARTLVRAMIARVMLGNALDTLGFVLSQAEVSPEWRATLAAALERGIGGPAGARRLMTIEYVIQFDGSYRLGVPYGIKPSRGGDPPLQWLQRPFFLPKATANLHAAHIEQIARFAEKREFGKFTACERQFFDSLGGGELNNPIGRMVLAMALPATQKIIESYWKKEDGRLAMIAELRKSK